jgi:hypothetical protein
MLLFVYTGEVLAGQGEMGNWLTRMRRVCYRHVLHFLMTHQRLTDRRFARIAAHRTGEVFVPSFAWRAYWYGVLSEEATALA